MRAEFGGIRESKSFVSITREEMASMPIILSACWSLCFSRTSFALDIAVFRFPNASLSRAQEAHWAVFGMPVEMFKDKHGEEHEEVFHKHDEDSNGKLFKNEYNKALEHINGL